MWGVAVIAALVLVATSLHGLTSTSNVVGNPDSTKAANLIATAFPPTPADFAHQVTDVVVVSSDAYTTASPASAASSRAGRSRSRRPAKVESVRSYLAGNRQLVSADHHAR